jgi:flagellar hook-associated protein 3 FlgL
MRIPNLTMSEAVVNRLNKLNRKQNALNEQIATGQRITMSSEDPQAASRVMRLRSEKMAAQQYAKNADTALGFAQASYAVLDRLRMLSDRAGELAVSSNSDTVSFEERKAYAVELNELIKDAVEAGNTRFQGEYLLNGTDTDSASDPFALVTDPQTNAQTAVRSAAVVHSVTAGVSAAAVVTMASTSGWSNGMLVSGTGIPAGTRIVSVDSVTQTVTLSNSVTVSANASLRAESDGIESNGAAIQISDTLEISPRLRGVDNIAVKDFINNMIALRDGLTSNSTANITTARASLMASGNGLIEILASNSSIQARLESVRAQSASRFNDMEALISRDADVDQAQAMVNLTRQQTAYQAAMQAGAQVLKMSLLDYI